MKTYDLHGYNVAIIQDEHAESPDHWGNDDCFLVYDHRQFTVERKGFDPETIFEHIQRTKRLFYDGYWVFPVYAYIHSGVSLSLGKTSYPFTCPWDTSYRGFALVKRQKGWTYSRKQATKVGKSIVSEWNQYLSGDVYGFEITDPKGNDVHSCWGFYGLEYCEEQANAEVLADMAIKFKARLQQVKTCIRNRVPLTHREQIINDSL